MVVVVLHRDHLLNSISSGWSLASSGMVWSETILIGLLLHVEAAPPYANGPAATISVEELKHPRKLANTIIIVHKISWP